MSEHKPYYGQENQHGQWWDGKDWRNLPSANDATNGFKEEARLAFRRIEYQSSLQEKNGHPDGCFTCPRCRQPHNIVGNFDLLCDGCVTTELANNSNHEAEILEFREKEKLHWSGVPQPEIVDRIKLREGFA